MNDDRNRDERYDERELRSMLSEQVQEQMTNEDDMDFPSDPTNNMLGETAASSNRIPKKKKKKHTGLKVLLGIIIILAAAVGILIGTKPGRKAVYSIAADYIFKEVERSDDTIAFMEERENADKEGKYEEGIANYLLFGIEEIGGARNTDSMMIASVDMNKGTIKLTSLMRDSYVEVPGWKSTKLNAAYAKGGVNLLIDTIEKNYKIHIDGYASVNFESFENIVDSLGGVTIELGAKEAKYLNKTNYISNEKYRTVKEGVNELNGNQLLGYCRVRKVETLGGVNNDYGRTLRQRRALSAIFDKLKSKNIFSMMSIANECMGYVTTSLTSDQIKEILEVVVENKVTSIETLRLPVDGMFSDPKKYNGTTYPLVYDWDKNINELYNFIYGTKVEEE